MDVQNILPLFFKNNDVVGREDDELNVLEVCLAAENVAGEWTIKGAQRIRNLWRIYLNNRPNSVNVREKLLVEGITLRGISVDLLASNPYVRDPNIPTTRVSISNVPLSYSNDNIKDKFTSMGYKLTSKIFNKRCRDRDNRLTRFLTGRRFFYMEKPAYPVSDHIQFGLFTGRVYHPEQAYDHPPPPTGPQNNQPQEESDTHQIIDTVFEEETILDDQDHLDHQQTASPVNSTTDSHNPFNVLANSEVNTNDSSESDNDQTVLDTPEPTETSTPVDSPDETDSSQRQDDKSDATSTTMTMAAKGAAGNKITDYMFPATPTADATPPDSSTTVTKGTPVFTAAPSNGKAAKRQDKKRQRLSPGQGAGKTKARRSNKGKT